MNLSGHNLALLVSLNAMLEECNITRAANRLHLSQPALSAQLSRLRELFNDPLLIPAQSGRGMVLTPLSEHLREPLRRALQVLEDTVSRPPVFDPVSADCTFTLGSNDNAAAIVAPRLVQLTRNAGFNGIRFVFRTLDFSLLRGQLESGEIDLALTSRDAVPGASQILLLEETFSMAQRMDHPRGVGPVTLDEYVALEHVIVSGRGGGFSSSIDELLTQRSLTRKVGVSVQSYSLVPLILQNSELVCTLPARFLNRYKNVLDAYALPFETDSFSLYATWHARFDRDSSHLWLRKQLRACL
ncbi:LysR family transcriptional regulator [Pseudomonas sp. DWP3-1-2]|uniref:LysR family transcriptional regulator n=1 Tax=Pseudomonas sp. DWP3-1-2 TaxID=2804645 RepID=UPI003CFA7950